MQCRKHLRRIARPFGPQPHGVQGRDVKFLDPLACRQQLLPALLQNLVRRTRSAPAAGSLPRQESPRGRRARNGRPRTRPVRSRACGRPGCRDRRRAPSGIRAAAAMPRRSVAATAHRPAVPAEWLARFRRRTHPSPGSGPAWTPSSLRLSLTASSAPAAAQRRKIDSAERARRTATRIWWTASGPSPIAPGRDGSIGQDHVDQVSQDMHQRIGHAQRPGR